MNVLLNARDAVESRRASEPEAPATICVTTRACADGQELRVEDTGCGISVEHQARLGEPFFTTKPVGAGTGLGLAVCRDLLRANHGSLKIESEEGRGTQVSVVFQTLAEEKTR